MTQRWSRDSYEVTLWSSPDGGRTPATLSLGTMDPRGSIGTTLEVNRFLLGEYQDLLAEWFGREILEQIVRKARMWQAPCPLTALEPGMPWSADLNLPPLAASNLCRLPHARKSLKKIQFVTPAPLLAQGVWTLVFSDGRLFETSLLLCPAEGAVSGAQRILDVMEWLADHNLWERPWPGVRPDGELPAGVPPAADLPEAGHPADRRQVWASMRWSVRGKVAVAEATYDAWGQPKLQYLERFLAVSG